MAHLITFFLGSNWPRSKRSVLFCSNGVWFALAECACCWILLTWTGDIGESLRSRGFLRVGSRSTYYCGPRNGSPTHQWHHLTLFTLGAQQADFLYPRSRWAPLGLPLRPAHLNFFPKNMRHMWSACMSAHFSGKIFMSAHFLGNINELAHFLGTNERVSAHFLGQKISSRRTFWKKIESTHFGTKKLSRHTFFKKKLESAHFWRRINRFDALCGTQKLGQNTFSGKIWCGTPFRKIGTTSNPRREDGGGVVICWKICWHN